MRILIAGLAKTGTTGLLYLIGSSLGKEVKLFLEPRQCTAAMNECPQHVVAKVLIGSSFDLASFASFDKKITLVRDPRDRLVSALLYSQYHGEYLFDDKQVRIVLDLLKQKERAPSSVPISSILEILGKVGGNTYDADQYLKSVRRALITFDDYVASVPEGLLYPYEDFVSGNYAALEDYLGIPMTGVAKVPKYLERVSRTKSHGAWRHWFTEKDVTDYRPLLSPWLRRYGYDADDWCLSKRPFISPEHGSAYFMRLVKEQRAQTFRNTYKHSVVLRWLPGPMIQWPVFARLLYKRRLRPFGKAKIVQAEPGAVTGWAIGENPGKPVRVALRANGVEVAQQIADKPCPGPSDPDRPMGNCGFSFEFSATQSLAVGDHLTLQAVDGTFECLNASAVYVTSTRRRAAGSMVQYQSFPEEIGDSRTLEKLAALQLPGMQGKRFLDVGCNEGFFCGYALWNGAARAVGIDKDMRFVAKARQRFPEGEFLHQSWDRLPQGPFDVILLASALHYAEDQVALIHALAACLSDQGTLVLELGIHPSQNNEWVRVKRGIDQRAFPTMDKVQEILQPYAWKFMGRSVEQSGDPIARYVLHVRPRRRVAYLLMQPPGYGKSSIGRTLFARADMTVVSGDAVLHQVAEGRMRSVTALEDILKQDFSTKTIDLATQRIFQAGLVHAYVELMVQQAGMGDFALDAYVPAEHHSVVREALTDMGFMPVQLAWDRVGEGSTSAKDAHERAHAFFDSLASMGPSPTSADSSSRVPFKRTKAVVEEARVAEGRLMVKGWALNTTGYPPSILVLQVGEGQHIFENYSFLPRPDVQKHFDLSHSECGYRLSVLLEGLPELADPAASVSLFAGDSMDDLSGPFRVR